MWPGPIALVCRVVGSPPLLMELRQPDMRRLHPLPRPRINSVTVRLDDPVECGKRLAGVFKPAGHDEQRRQAQPRFDVTGHGVDESAQVRLGFERRLAPLMRAGQALGEQRRAHQAESIAKVEVADDQSGRGCG